MKQRRTNYASAAGQPRKTARSSLPESFEKFKHLCRILPALGRLKLLKTYVLITETSAQVDPQNPLTEEDLETIYSVYPQAFRRRREVDHRGNQVITLDLKTSTNSENDFLEMLWKVVDRNHDLFLKRNNIEWYAADPLSRLQGLSWIPPRLFYLLRIAQSSDFFDAPQYASPLFYEDSTRPIVPPKEGIPISAIVDSIQRQPFYRRQILFQREVAACPAEYSPFERDPILNPLFPSQLYRHQVEAINALNRGENVHLCTNTSSGKSLIFTYYSFQQVLRNPKWVTLIFYPTKALASDQLRSITALTENRLDHAIKVATLDGDTVSSRRKIILSDYNIILTNPDVFHTTACTPTFISLPQILSQNKTNPDFFSRIRFIVVDESHMYTGVFGTHVSLVLRRMARICRLHHSQPQFLSASATLSNPVEHCLLLLPISSVVPRVAADSSPQTLVNHNYAPRSKKTIVFWNSYNHDVDSFLNDKEILMVNSFKLNASSIVDSNLIMTYLTLCKIKSLCFCNSRRLTEILYKKLIYSVDQYNSALVPMIASYRAGYQKSVRKVIETQLFHNQILSTICTNALELGIDIGDLDCTVQTGFPGSVSSFWQQIGRAGRQEKQNSLAFFCASASPIDQFFMKHPEGLLEGAPESGVLDISNEAIASLHYQCAAFESPLGPDSLEEEFFGSSYPRIRDALVAQRLLRREKDAFLLVPKRPPKFSLRSICQINYSVFSTKSEKVAMDIIPADNALYLVHPGAVYLFQGETYLVDQVDYHTHSSFVSVMENPYYYTRTCDLTNLTVLSTTRSSGAISLGRCKVTDKIYAYKKFSCRTHQVIGCNDLDCPDRDYVSDCLSLFVSNETRAELETAGLDYLGGVHAVTHLLCNFAPLVVKIHPKDLFTVCIAQDQKMQVDSVTVFDTHGGIGICGAYGLARLHPRRRLFDNVRPLLSGAESALQSCSCETGCPHCCHHYNCTEGNERIDKRAGLRILRRLIEVLPPTAP